MKLKKKLSLMMVLVLLLNLFTAVNVKVKAEDIDKPLELKSISVSSQTVSTQKSVDMTIEASAKNGLSDEAYALYVMNTGKYELQKEVTLKLKDGKYTSTIFIGDNNEVGNWKISFISLTDKAGNAQAFYNSNLNPNMGIDLSSGDFAVSDGSIDVTPPQLKNITINNKIQCIGSTLKMGIDAADAGSGLSDEAYAVYVRDAMEKEITLKLVNGKYEGSLLIDDSFAIGGWTMSHVILQDKAGNSAAYYNSKRYPGMGTLDLQYANFTVNKDTVGPTLNAASISKKLAKLGDKLVVTVEAKDLLSGLAPEANLLYVNGDKEKEVTLKLVDGKYQGDIAIDDNFGDGNWQISFVTLYDNSGNATAGYNINVNGSTGIDLSAADFIVDCLKPNKPEMKLSTTEPTNKDVIVTLAADNDAKLEYRLNGSTQWTAYDVNGIVVSQNTIVYSRATDLAGNISDEASIEIKNIDKQAITINVIGIENGKTYNTGVIAFISTNKPSAKVTSTLNGVKYDGSKIVINGDYELKINVVDLAGNVAEVTYKFTIKIPVPVIDNGIGGPNPQPIAIDGNINVKFTGKIVKADNFDKIKLLDEANNTISATFEINNDTIVVKAMNKLDYGKKYLVVIPEGAVKDENGNAVVAISYNINTVALPWTEMTPAQIKLTPATPVPSELVPATPVPSTLTPATPVPSVLTPALPKTGSAIDMKVMMSMGCALTLAGIAFLVFKKKEN